MGEAIPVQSQQIGDVHTGLGGQTFVGYAGGNVTFNRPVDPKEGRAKAVRECRNALFVTDPAVDRATIASTKGRRVPGTCEWIKQDDKYQQWLEGKIPLLWICGGPGKGKTTLSIFLIEELQREQSVMYYFCSSEDKKRNNASAVLRMLLYQITSEHVDFGEQFLQYFEGAANGDTSLASDFSAAVGRLKASLSSIETLWMVFARLCRDPRLANLAYILDGLDECDELSRDWLASKLVELDADREACHPPKIIVISREMQVLKKVVKIRLDPDYDAKIGSDIERLVSARVEELADRIEMEATFKQEVKRQLLERSEGTFLWVGFAVGELIEKRSSLEVERTLQDLPRGLPAIYSRMLGQIESREQAMVSLILQWTTLSARPLSLTELACVLDCEATASHTKEDIVRHLVKLCQALVIQAQAPSQQDRRRGQSDPIEAEQDSISALSEQTVGLVHQSARDYLLRAEREVIPTAFRFQQEEAHMHMAWKCLDCIGGAYMLQGRSERRGTVSPELGPLIDYAMGNWPHHAREASTWFEQLVKHPSGIFNKSSALRDQWWERYRKRDFWNYSSRTFPVLHIASHVGIVPWIRRILKGVPLKVLRARAVNKRDSDGRTALAHAVQQKHWIAMRFLLQHGADTTSRTSDHLGMDDSILNVAARDGHEIAVKILLEHGADQNNAENPVQRTALHYAALFGHTKVLQMLLDRKANVEARDGDGQTALMLAAEGGHEGVVELLRTHGASIDLGTDLRLAAQFGHMNWVEELLNRGADINARDQRQQTALFIASRSGRKEVVELLLDRGADINARDQRQQTALFNASLFGGKEVVELLLDRGADINARDQLQQTALFDASQVGWKEVVELLLDRGAEINAKDGWQQTALFGASSSGGKEVVELLLDRGADINAKDGWQQTALFGASSSGGKEEVELLLDRGADINSKDQDGETPLCQARRRYRKDIEQLLLSRGANECGHLSHEWPRIR